jgi:predicted flap endonuclease-1-like 5' DNA nuclease
MDSLNNFINQFPALASIFVLMLSTFLIGYFAGWWLEQNRTRKLIDRLKNEVNGLQTKGQINDIETIFTEIKPKIIAVVKETQEEIKKSEDAEKTTEKASLTYLSYTKQKPLLDFTSFGNATNSEKDSLTKINGIGPYIEQKLNEIDIYTYNQISNLKESDIRSITEIIDFFPGRIERDDWVGQATALLIKK